MLTRIIDFGVNLMVSTLSQLLSRRLTLCIMVPNAEIWAADVSRRYVK